MTPECVSKKCTGGGGGCCVLSWLLMDINPQAGLGSLLPSDLYFSICICLLHISATQNITTKQNIITILCVVFAKTTLFYCILSEPADVDSSKFLYLEGSHSPLCPCPELHFCRCEDNMNKKQNQCCWRSASSLFLLPTFLCGLQLNSSV